LPLNSSNGTFPFSDHSISGLKLRAIFKKIINKERRDVAKELTKKKMISITQMLL
jgi:hypothetical protein